MQPSYPVYIPSKGRWDSRLTMRALDQMGVRYTVIVEAVEANAYRAALDERYATVITLDPAYQRDYDHCTDLAPDQSRGSGPARNFAWDHAAAAGAAWHWVIDDNIQAFYRLNQNTKVKVTDGVYFRPMEDFTARYVNVAMAGPHYEHFLPRREASPPFRINSRIYSCNLIRTDVPFRWRGRYNEDTILSLDLLKAGWCTVLFNAFLQNKLATQRLAGGNTDELYAGGTLAKSQMIAQLHPDVCRVTQRFGRPHHYCDYRPFKVNRLRRKPGVVIPTEPNEYGMRLVSLTEGAA